MLPFPKKTSFPDPAIRRAQLERWLQDIVSKVSMHVCDDAAARQASLFLGLKASAYLDIPEERRAPTMPGFVKALPVFRLPSQSTEVTVTTEVGEGSANVDELSQSAGAISIKDGGRGGGGGGGGGSVAEALNNSAVPADATRGASRTAGVSSVRLYEAKALYDEGLIGEADLMFARKGIVDEILQSDKTPVTKLREASELLRQSLITKSEYESLKREVLVVPEAKKLHSAAPGGGTFSEEQRLVVLGHVLQENTELAARIATMAGRGGAAGAASAVDPNFLCPITTAIMEDPVFAMDGHT
jgi:hypothetical protein